jgi:hypothetical protein
MIVICLLPNINSGQVKSTKHMFSNICDTGGIQSDLYIFNKHPWDKGKTTAIRLYTYLQSIYY